MSMQARLLNILLDTGNYFENNVNQGDLASYQCIARQLRELWPDCRIRCITRNDVLLRDLVPVFEPLRLTAPRIPLLPANTVGDRDDASTCSREDATRINSAIDEAHLVLATGGGYFSNDFAEHAWSVLDTLEAGVRAGKPTAILSCGFEPIGVPALTAKMLAVLPRLNLIACREDRLSPNVLLSHGVLPARIMSAGDEAIDLALRLRALCPGRNLGVNLRMADYAGVDFSTVARIRAGLLRSAEQLSGSIVPLPISMRGPSDLDAIDRLLAGVTRYERGSVHRHGPDDIIRQVATCRVVVAGSYHAAVFALSQGVSVVALTASSHYRAKMAGLKAQFGSGCHLVALDHPDTEQALNRAIATAWAEADEVREGLLQAARRQAKASQGVYRQLKAIVDGAPAPTGRIDDLSSTAVKAATATPSSMKLSPDEIETFHQHGYVGPFTAFEPVEMERVKAIIDQQVLPTPTQYCPFGLRCRHLDSRTVYDLCSAPAIIDRMASIHGPDLILWNSNLFDKPPATREQMEEYPWHQDHYNWNMEPVLNISAWLAITPATVENGCVELIPGSHRQIIPSTLDTDADLSLRFGGVASDPAYVDPSRKVAMTLSPGQFFLFNERILHHSNPNRSHERRLGLAIRVTVPTVRVTEPFPGILVRGSDHVGINRLVEPPAVEPDADWVAGLPVGSRYEFDRCIPGKGWHLRENDGRQSFAWTGLEAESWLDFRPVGTGDHVLRVEIVHMLKPDAAKKILLLVNGKPMKTRLKAADGLVLLEAHVPGQILSAFTDRVRVTLRGPAGIRPCDINPISTDKRKLGVAVRRVSLTPARSWFTLISGYLGRPS
jgi:polysaccharide pyruvyl transferase WcaK-like protein